MLYDYTNTYSKKTIKYLFVSLKKSNFAGVYKAFVHLL